MNNKKLKELKVLRTFYAESEYHLIKHSENPDFILSDGNGNVFGVEVTEYYDSPTSGRFKNIPNYFNRLVNNGFIHKEDIGKLVVSEITKIEPDGKENPFKNKGVLKKVPQSPDRIETLKKLVTGKNSKYTQYDKALKDIDLLIYDKGDLVAGLEIQKTEITNYLRKQEKENTLISPFRKIVIVIEEPSQELIKILLKSD